MNRFLVVVIVAILVFVGMGMFLSTKKKEAAEMPASNFIVTSSPVFSASPQSEQAGATPVVASEFVDPVADFKQRVTNKFFGTYVTPNNSPVQPEKFTGYHAGADAEYSDVSSDVPVYVIADGTVLVARWASGYGGLIAIQHQIHNQPFIAIYGHVNPNKLPNIGQQVKRGDQISILGKGYSHETDGERKHLHFGLVKGTVVNIKGYVLSKSELTTWIDPLTMFSK